MIRLIRPTLELKEKALAYRQEHFDNGELIINGSELLDKTESYEEWLESIKANESPETADAVCARPKGEKAMQPKCSDRCS